VLLRWRSISYNKGPSRHKNTILGLTSSETEALFNGATTNFIIKGKKLKLWLRCLCAVYVQRHSLFFLRIFLLGTKCFGWTGHLQVYRLLMVKDSAAHCNAVFFPPIVVSPVILVTWVTISFSWVSLCCTWLLLILFCLLWLPWMFLLGREFCYVLVGYDSRCRPCA
jgi:hypothetical protein